MTEFLHQNPEKPAVPERDRYSLARVIEEAARATNLPELKNVVRGSMFNDMRTYIRMAGVEPVGTSTRYGEGQHPRNNNRGGRIFSHESQRAILAVAVDAWSLYPRTRKLPPEIQERLEVVRRVWKEKIDEFLLLDTY
ncbi:hypothetical protein K2Y00_00885 [Patescibacteria group bacterium]|nr:hypothetical protein [Patescibacteria group bacterium]